MQRLRTSWLSQGKKRSVKVGVSGGDHAKGWPKDCEFYVLEEELDPVTMIMPRIHGRFSY